MLDAMRPARVSARATSSSVYRRDSVDAMNCSAPITRPRFFIATVIAD